MKVELNIDEKFKEILVTISTDKINDEVQELVNYIEYKEDYLVGIADDQVCVLDISDIIRVFVEDRKVFVVTTKGKFIVRKKLYEMNNLLTKDFVKISQSEIANIKFIKNLDLSIRGTIVIVYKNSDISYVSRRLLKDFKTKLGYRRKEK